MTNEEFITFVKRPRYMPNQDGIQLFEDKEEDENSKTYYSHAIITSLIIVSALLIQAFLSKKSLTSFFVNGLWCLSLGIAIFWTYTEYFFHRFVLHRELNIKPDEPDNPERNYELFKKHLQHHVFMNQRYRIVINYK